MNTVCMVLQYKDKQINALIEVWIGSLIGNILLMKYNFCAKSSLTLPSKLEDKNEVEKLKSELSNWNGVIRSLDLLEKPWNDFMGH